MIKECIYKETDKVTVKEAAELYYFQQMQGVDYQHGEAYAEHIEKIMEARNQEIGASIPAGRFPIMESAMMGISAFKKKPVVICELN